MRKWQIFIGAVISIVFLVIALIGIDWQQTGQALSQADWRYIVLAGGSFVIYLVTRSARWRVLLGPEVTLAETFAITNIGYLISNITPARLGDPARAVAIGLSGKVKVGAALSTVVVERVLDMLMVVIMLAISLPFVGAAGGARRIGWLAGGASVIALAVLFALAHWPQLGERLIRWLVDRVPGLSEEQRANWLESLNGLLEGLAPLRSTRLAIMLLLWSMFAWLFVVGYYWGVMSAFLERPPVIQGVFLTCATALGMAVPAAPGAVGVFHSAARYALELFGVPASQAILVAFATHALQYIAGIALGAVGLAQQNLSLSRLRAEVRANVKEEEQEQTHD